MKSTGVYWRGFFLQFVTELFGSLSRDFWWLLVVFTFGTWLVDGIDRIATDLETIITLAAPGHKL